jgi:Fic family protein
MRRVTGRYAEQTIAGERVSAFIPEPLPPRKPPLELEPLAETLRRAEQDLSRLDVASGMVPSLEWFIYGFVRKEAVLSSQIEGTQASLVDLLKFEAAADREKPNEDVLEVCNYLDALAYARAELARPKGLPLSMRLLGEAHRRLMKGARGAHKQPGEVRRTQNWIGGTRPSNAIFVPPPSQNVPDLLAKLERYLHAPSDLPSLIRIGLAHVQFETIHPYLDGNGRIGRLLIYLMFVVLYIVC